MLKHDVTVFMIAYWWVLSIFFVALYTIYPRSGEHTFPMAESFNNVVPGIKAVVELSFIGEAVRITVPQQTMSFLNFGMWLSISTRKQRHTVISRNAL